MLMDILTFITIFVFTPLAFGMMLKNYKRETVEYKNRVKRKYKYTPLR